MTKICIIGYGFVGSAVSHGFKDLPQMVVDPLHSDLGISDLPEDVTHVFLCVPTPVGTNGSVDGSIALDSVEKLRERLGVRTSHGPLLIVKSTLTPPILHEMEKIYPRMVFNPEFLTEKNAVDDFMNPRLHVFGAESEELSREAHDLYIRFSDVDVMVPTFMVNLTEASLIKYGVNSFLAMKVTFFNELYDLCQASGADFEMVRMGLSTDTRIGVSHTAVPGHENQRGYSGSCFPKDTAALVSYARSLVNSGGMKLVEAGIRRNAGIRLEYNPSERELAQGLTRETWEAFTKF